MFRLLMLRICDYCEMSYSRYESRPMKNAVAFDKRENKEVFDLFIIYSSVGLGVSAVNGSSV